MEISVEKGGGAEISKKSRSVDVQRLYTSKVSNEGNGKRRSGEDDEVRNKRKRKSKKEVALSSFEPKVKRGRSSFVNGASSCLMRSDGPLLGLSQSFNRTTGLNGISLNLDGNGNVIRIPKKPRGYVGSKSHVSKPSGSSSSVDQIAKLNSEFDESRTARLSSPQHAEIEREEDPLVVDNGNGGDDDESSSRKGKRKHRKKRKGLASDSSSVTKKVEPEVDNTGSISDDSQDDEENLEQNAARMLSSRFDPRCTGPSSKNKSSLIHTVRDIGSHVENLEAGLVSPSADSASRVLRPRNDYKEKGFPRKRRHFYEVVYRDEDAHWFLNRRIKVFWPLDESWYYGLVNDYDEETKIHHVKYDDRDMEWISLQNERFKLLLYPSEVKDEEKLKESVINDKPTDRTKTDLTMTDTDTNIGIHTDSEPISSWLARSSHRSKSSSGLKKQKTSHLSPSVVPPLPNKIGNAHGNEDVGFLERDAGKMCILASADRLADGGKGEKSVLEGITSSKENRSPVVYFRRRFRKKKEGSCCVSVNNNVHTSPPICVVSVADSFQTSKEYSTSFDCMDPDKLLWSIDCDGMLKLNMALIQFKEFKTQLSLPLRPFLEYPFGAEIFRLSFLSLLLRYGTIVTTWPKVHLEVLFVDNVVGLRFFLFEGCLKQAVAFVFLILTVFHEPNEPGKYVDLKMPVTSIRFKLSCIQDLRKQHVFAFYSFFKLKYSNWLYLDSMFEQHCLFTKHLPLPECTLDNIKALEGGSKHIHLNSVGSESSFQVTGKKFVQGVIPIGVSKSCNENRRQSPNSDEKHGMFLPFAISFSAAPTLFFSLHLKLLMESSIARIHLLEHDPDCSLEHIGNTCKLAADDCALVECCSEDAPQVTSERTLRTSLADGACSACFSCSKPLLGIDPVTMDDSGSTETDVIGQSQKCEHNAPELERFVPLPQPLISKDIASPVISGTSDDSILNGMSVEIPAFDLAESSVDGKSPGVPRASDFSLDMSDGIICSPNPTGPKSLWPRNRTNSSSSPLGDISPVWPDGKTNIIRSGFGNGPRKPRTQVQYALPFGGSEFSSKHKAHNQNGHPYRRIRRASEKRTSDASRSSQKNLELLACDANLLITLGDKGWRECGARVVLELADHNEWRLAVKFSGSTKYSHKVHHNFQPGSTNRYTHAMMWKGGKDWALEFPDRSQWMLFKEMHEECYNRNIRAASVKNIPIPGVLLIEEFDDNSAESRFTHSSPNYFRQIETDVDMAMNPSKILYDMDSDDEQWILTNGKSFQTRESTGEVITDELFEKTMDMFEKVSNAQQRDHFTVDEIEKLMAGVVPMEVTKAIFQHWQQKRQRTGIPLIRQLQPPSWERYQQKMKEWEQSMTRANTDRARGGQATVPPKPAMFAFCLKPRGLELLNKGSKHRSHRRFSVSGHNHANLGDQDGLHAFGRRLNSFTFGDEKAIPGNSLEYSDTSPMLHPSTGMYSPRDAGGPGYFSLNSVASEWNNRPKYHKKSKKIATFLPSSKLQMVPSHNQRTIGKRNGVQRWNMGLPEWPSQKHQQSDVSLRRGIEQLGGRDLEEFRLRDASGAAKHAHNIARLKRDRARRLLSRADIAIHKAVSALMTADAVKASYEDSYGGQLQDNDRMSE